MSEGGIFAVGYLLFLASVWCIGTVLEKLDERKTKKA